MDEWRSMDSAPTDGQRILVWTETAQDDLYVRFHGEHIRTIQIAEWGETYGGGMGWVTQLIGLPKFWMPLPPPPQGPRP